MSDPRRLPRDAGFTLVELLVAMLLFSMVGGIALTLVVSSATSAQNTRQYADINEEARNALNRMSRELREAKQIDTTYPSPGDGHAGLTFEVDFDNSGTITTTGPDPEILTYCYQANQILLVGAAVNCDTSPAGVPILSADVTSFTLDYRSSQYSYDANGDGATTWQELDANPTTGNNNGYLDTPELRYVDAVIVSFTVAEGGHSQTYQTQVDLRNR